MQNLLLERVVSLLTPNRPDDGEEILAECLTDALGEINRDRTVEAADPGATVLSFFR